ncbi:MAG: FAD-dependent monooxygenase [Thermoleophilaceae bacterium]
MTAGQEARGPGGEAPVVVVGMGPVGACVALLLSASGVRTVVLERESEPHGEGRAVALDDTALRVLQAAGLGPVLRRLLAPARSVRFSAASGRALLELRPGMSALGHPELSFFNQPDLERALRDALGRAPGVELRSGHEVLGIDPRADGVEVVALDRATGRQERFHAAVVLGCDGARSTVRSAIGARLRGLSSPRRWLVLDTRREGDPPGCFEFGCDPARPWVHGTLPGGRHRWEFLLAPEEGAAELERPAAVARLLEERGHSGAEVLRAAVYAHHARVADRLVRGRVMLLGDAAHLSPPFAGQGLSAGLRDAMAAAWRAAGVARGRFDPEALAGYGTERRPDAVRATRPRRRGRRGGADARPAGGRGARRRPPGDARAARSRRLGAGRGWRPSGGVPRNALRLASGRSRRPGEGRPLPQPVVELEDEDGRELLLDDALGPGFALIGLDVDPRALLDRGATEELDRLEARLVTVATGRTDRGSRPAGAVSDPEGRLRRLLGAPSGRLVLVRPDRVVLAVVAPEEAGPVLTRLRTSLLRR